MAAFAGGCCRIRALTLSAKLALEGKCETGLKAFNTASIVSSFVGSPTAISSFVSLWKLMLGVSFSPNIFQPV
jgi:hypothetical protein